jgi:hypothetical protein
MQHSNKTPADTEKEIQTKFKYPADTTAHAAEIPRQMSLFIQQDQITSNLKNDSETPATQGKYYPSIPKKVKHPRKYENQVKIATSRLTLKQKYKR